MSAADGPGSSRGRRWKVAALAALVFTLATSPVTVAGLAFWAASDSWEFAGGGFHYWFFIKGSTVDRLGFVAASAGPARYVVRLSEGTDPGETVAVYDSGALPRDVVETYADRCRALGITVRKQVAAAAEARLVCEGDLAVVSSDDVWVIAARAAEASITEVRVIAGPGLTATYNF